jgi:uncharacterized protein YbjT (DUF2867 family)
LEFVKGDVLDGGKVMATLTGCDAAVVALGAVKGGPVDVCSRGTDLILQAAAKVGARRVAVVTSLGVGDSRDEVPWVFRVIAALFLKQVMADKEKQEELVRASGLDWTLIRPTGLVDGPATGQAVSGPGRMKDSLPAGFIPKGQVTRADVAAFVLGTLVDPAAVRSTWFVTA